MDEHDITAEQARKMAERVGHMLRYLGALRRRVEERRFPPRDRFRQDVERAYDGVHRLWVALHYMSCEGSVGETRGKGRSR